MSTESRQPIEQNLVTLTPSSRGVSRNSWKLRSPSASLSEVNLLSIQSHFSPCAPAGRARPTEKSVSSRTLPLLYELSSCQTAITKAIGSRGGLFTTAANGCHPGRHLITITKEVYAEISIAGQIPCFLTTSSSKEGLQASPVLIFAFHPCLILTVLSVWTGGRYANAVFTRVH